MFISLVHKICDCDTNATLFSFGGKLFFLQNQYNTQKHSLLQSISYNHIYCSLIPQVAFASIGSANPRSLQAGAKIGQSIADHLSEGIQIFLIVSDKWCPFCYMGIL